MTQTQYVYLAGGMKGCWQDLVMKCLSDIKNVEFFDPRTHGLTSEKDYTDWDLAHIDTSDILFAYLAENNPSGQGLMLELGYAAALGKRIIFVEEEGDKRTRYYGMARALSQNVRGLYTGIEELRAWLTA